MIRKSISDFLIYSITPILSRLAPFLLLPIYTRTLTSIEYGIFDYIISISVFLKTIFYFSISTTFWNFYEKVEFKRYLTGMLVISLISAFILGFFGFWFIETEYFFQFSLYYLSEIIYLFFFVGLLIVRGKLQTQKYLILQVLYSLTLIVSTLLVPNYFNDKIVGFTLPYILSSFIGLILVYRLIFKSINKPSRKILKEIFMYSTPLLMSNILAMALILGDRFLIKLFFDYGILGSYAFVAKISGIMKSFFVDIFFQFWNPIRWKIFHLGKKGRAIMSNLFEIIVPVFILVTCIFSLCIPELMFLFTDNSEFNDLNFLLPSLSFNKILYGFYYFGIMGILFMERTKMILHTVIIGVTIYLLAAYILLNTIGISSISTAYFLSVLCMLFYGNYCSQKLYPLQFSKSFKIAGLSFILPISFIYLFTILNEKSLITYTLYILIATLLIYIFAMRKTIISSIKSFMITYETLS